jgi:WD40 repeat protein
MTDPPADSQDDLDLLDQFLAEYAAATDREKALARWVGERPHLADECRLLAAYDALAAVRVPDEVAGVELLEPIGRGGMGLVYEGWERSVERAVAVKLCPAVGDPLGRARFLAECRTLAGLHQTSIVPVLAAGREGLWLYCVMPLIEGASLAEVLRRARGIGPGSLPPLPALVAGPEPAPPAEPPGGPVHTGPAYLRSAAEVLAMAADAIAYAHQRGVWHLDLKPANLMVEETGHCWVIDFGPTRNLGAGQSAGEPGATYLTTAYAAPEQWCGEGDARSDVWGLGATLYELLTLRRPFPDRQPGRAAATLEWNPSPPRALAPDVPEDLQAICLKALENRPDDRYVSAADFAADLRRWLDGEEPHARPWPLFVRLRHLARRHRAWVAAIGASVLGIFVALVLLWRGEQIRGRQAAAEAEAALVRANLRREADAHAQSRVWNTLEQARARLASPVWGRRAEVRRLLLDAARERRAVADAEANRRLGVVLRSLYVENLGLLDAAAPRPEDSLALPTVPGSGFRDWPADIHPDGRLIAIGMVRRPVVWRRGGPKPEPTTEDARQTRSRVAYSPAGHYLAELRPPETGGGLRLWDAEASRMLGELIPAGSAGAVVWAVGFNGPESRLWAARADGRIESWCLPSLSPAERWPVAEPTHPGVSAAAFAPGAELAALGGADGKVAVYDSTGAAVVRIAVPTGQRVEALAWSPDARQLAVGTHDGLIHVYRRDGVPVYRVTLGPSGVTHMRFSPDGRWLATHHRHSSPRVWDAHTGRLVLIHPVPIWGFARDGRSYAATTSDRAEFGELLLPEGVDRYDGHLSAVEQFAWAPEGGRFITLSSDFEVRVWDAARPGAATVFAAPPATGGFWAEQGAVALGPGGRQAAYASGGLERACAVVWDVPSGREVSRWKLPGGFEKLVPAGPGRFLSVREETNPDPKIGNVTTVVRLLEVGKPVPEGRVIRAPRPTDERRFINHWLLPDGRHYLWSGPRLPAGGRRVELYEVETGRLVWQIVPPTEPADGAPTCVLAEDLRTLWVGDGSPTWFRYDLPPRDPPSRVTEPPPVVSSDRRWVVTTNVGARGGLAAAVLRRGPDGEPWVEFPHRDPLGPTGTQCHFSPDGRHLAWGTASGSVVVIDLAALQTRVAQFEAELAALE